MQRLSSRWSAIPIVTIVALGVSCGGGGADGGMPPPTTVIAKTSSNSGDAQTATVGQPLPNPVQVLVTDNGSPAAGVTVTWSTTSGGSLAPASATTATDGIASSEWTLGTTAGAQTASATLSGASGSPVGFTATAAADAPTTIIKAGGDDQTAETGTQLALPVQAKVTDQHGNGVQGVPVDWAVSSGTVSSPSVNSNATGVSGVNVTVGVVGPIVITATAGGLNGSPLSFDATSVVPTPTPSTIGVTVRNDNFLSDRNGSVNPAVDTVAVNGTVTWTWAGGALTHNVTSTGSPSFTSSATKSAPATHAFTFATAGIYNYFCTIHGTPTTGMRGRIVVR
jgi:plastocyanin